MTGELKVSPDQGTNSIHHCGGIGFFSQNVHCVSIQHGKKDSS